MIMKIVLSVVVMNNIENGTVYGNDNGSSSNMGNCCNFRCSDVVVVVNVVILVVVM